MHKRKYTSGQPDEAREGTMPMVSGLAAGLVCSLLVAHFAVLAAGSVHTADRVADRRRGRATRQSVWWPTGPICLCVAAVVVCCSWPTVSAAQETAGTRPPASLAGAQTRVTAPVGLPRALFRVTCPGEPPENLTSVDCRFTPRLRFQEFVSSSVTDEAFLGAVSWGIVAQIRSDPPEWKGDLRGLGERIGIRYEQTVAKGLSLYALGALMRTDPRSVTYASDPKSKADPTVSRRVGHVFVDFATVRHSSVRGDGSRLPSPVFAAAVLSAYAGNPFLPAGLRTPSETAKRAASSLGTALAFGAYREFQPELLRALGHLLGRH